MALNDKKFSDFGLEHAAEDLFEKLQYIYNHNEKNNFSSPSRR